MTISYRNFTHEKISFNVRESTDLYDLDKAKIIKCCHLRKNATQANTTSALEFQIKIGG